MKINYLVKYTEKLIVRYTHKLSMLGFSKCKVHNYEK